MKSQRAIVEPPIGPDTGPPLSDVWSRLPMAALVLPLVAGVALFAAQ